MSLIFTVVSAFLFSLVFYIDEYLTVNNSVAEDKNIHKRIGGVFLISMILGVISIGILGFLINDFSMTNKGLYISLFSAIPMVISWAAYFYLFQKFPANKIIPLFGIGSFWIIMIEFLMGDPISFTSFLGIIFLAVGTYFLDVGSLSWKIPSRLVLYMLPVTLLFSLNFLLAKIVSENDSVINYFFYQYLVITVSGLILFFVVKSYRDGFLDRVKNQGKVFIGSSLLAESLAQGAFFTSTLAASYAILASHVSAIISIEYIFLMGLLYFFPIGVRNQINIIQVFSVFLMVIGVFFIEFFK